MRAASRITRKPKQPAESGQQPLLLHGISWDAYELMLDAFAEERVRMTYDRGDLELLGPNMGDGFIDCGPRKNIARPRRADLYRSCRSTSSTSFSATPRS